MITTTIAVTATAAAAYGALLRRRRWHIDANSRPMTISLTALSIYTGIETLRTMVTWYNEVQNLLAWVGEVAGILGMFGLCVHVALAWEKPLVFMRTVAALVASSTGIMIGISVAIYAALSSSDRISPQEPGEGLELFYCVLISTVIICTGIMTGFTALVIYARSGVDRLAITLFGGAGLLTAIVGVMGASTLSLGYPSSNTVAWAFTSTAVLLYGCAQFANHRIRTPQTT